MRIRGLAFAGLFALLSASAFAQSPVGTWKFVQDSDGAKPKAGAVIKLTLSDDGAAVLKAVQPGEVVEDTGTWSQQGKLITVTLPQMEIGCRSKAFSLAGTALTLPFKVLNEGPGASTWRFDAAPQEAAAPPDGDRPTGNLAQVLKRTLAESQEQDNEQQRRNLDRLASLALSDVKGGLAEAYYVQSVAFFMKSYYYEAWYGFAKAANLQQTNGVYLNNLSMVLMELDKYDDALPILEQAVRWFPSLDPLWGNLAAAHYKMGNMAQAEKAVQRAMALSPRTGLYQYLYGKILVEKGRKQEAKKYFELAWEYGYSGSGREGEPGSGTGTGGSGTGSSGQGSSGASGTGQGSQGASGGRPSGERPSPGRGSSANKGPKQIPPEWVGHYEAKYARARSGETGKEANTQFGQGMTGTNINLQTLACAKEFSMDISSMGNISGHGKVMYVYQGTAASPVMGLMPMPLTAGMGGFAVNLKNGYQIRDWSFSGKVDPDGNVEIQGMPQGQLDCLNVGQWEKRPTWSCLPPDAAGPAMKGPFHMTLATGKESGPHIRVDQWLDLGDTLIRRIHYQAFIVKSQKPITPDCKYEKPPEAKCPASEYIKTKVAMTPAQGVTVEASTTYTKGDGGVESSSETTTKMGTDAVNLDTSGKISVEASKGMFTGSAEFNPTDGSYAVSVGIGIDTGSVLKDAPAGISQKIELVYDSKCGWGFKGTMGAKIGGTSAGVEGAVFFNKGL